MTKTWTGLGIGTKNSDGEWLEMHFSEKNISSNDLDCSQGEPVLKTCLKGLRRDPRKPAT